MTNQHDIDFDYATSLANQARDLMAQHRIPPTPDNFAVWFKYAHGNSPPLKMAINVLLSNQRKFDDATSSDLFRAYVGGKAPEHAAEMGVSDQLSALITSAQQFLVTAIDDNRAQLLALDDVSRNASLGDPRYLIERLVSELSKATNRATTLEANFVDASSELDSIRQTLEHAELQAKTDVLTGLANRRALEEFLQRARIHSMESGEELSAFLLDIDHFKNVNDTYGHQVGDQVLKLMGGVLREHVRDGDLAARYGGEELMAVLPNTDLHRCMSAAERVRDAISKKRIRRRTSGEDIFAITISAGVAQFRHGETADELLGRCDRALYLAKRSGRNRVMSENDSEEDASSA